MKDFHLNREAMRLLAAVIMFVWTACSSSTFSPAQNVIAVNTAGYLPDEPKLALTNVSLESKTGFEIIDVSSYETVFEGEIRKGQKEDPASGDIIHELNFSKFNETGRFKVVIPALNLKSPEFSIGNQVFNQATYAALESFFYQRCGIHISNGTQWSHQVCHIDDAVFYNNPRKRKNVTGGWHDAGDYGKYVVNTAVSLGYILYLFDDQPHKFSDGQLEIPESANGEPDLMDEAKWALRWMLKMQNEKGGVFHKVQKKKWTGEYLPEKDPDPRYIFEVSSAATADFAAVCALGARLFKEIDSDFADTLATAAVNAWDYLSAHPQIVPENGFKNPAEVKGGEYGDSNDLDERVWASVELYRLNSGQRYHQYFLENYKKLNEPKTPPISWKNVGKFALYAYTKLPVSQQDSEAKLYISQGVDKYANQLVKQVTSGGYRVALQQNDYYWGSNSVALGYAFDLIKAYEIMDNTSYRQAALDQLHYILGRNPFGLSYVTGVGSNPVRNPYHQFSSELNVRKPVPGMVVGGPNSKRQLNGRQLSAYPAKAYEDNSKNYMVNETAINYTAPFVYLAGYFSQAEDKIAVTQTKHQNGKSEEQRN